MDCNTEFLPSTNLGQFPVICLSMVRFLAWKDVAWIASKDGCGCLSLDELLKTRIYTYSNGGSLCDGLPIDYIGRDTRKVH